MNKDIFYDIRPYYDEELPDALKRIAENEHFPAIVKFLFPEENIKDFTKKFLNIKTINEFQLEIMWKAVYSIVESTSTGYKIKVLKN